MENVIKFVKSKEGHGSFIILMCLVMVVLTTDYLAKEILNIKGDEWLYIAYSIAIGFSVVFELSVAFCALNAYRVVSWLLAVLGVIMVRGTLSQLTHDTFSTGWLVGWIISGFPPLFVAFLSHRLAAMAKIKVENEVKEETDKTAPIRDLTETIINYPSLNSSLNGSFKEVKKNA